MSSSAIILLPSSSRAVGAGRAARRSAALRGAAGCARRAAAPRAQLLAETAAKRTVPFEDGARLVEAIPRFESSDADIDAAYWYRWRVALEHLRRDVNVGGGRAGDKSYDYGWALQRVSAARQLAGRAGRSTARTATIRRRRDGCARPRSSTTTAPAGTATRRSTSGRPWPRARLRACSPRRSRRRHRARAVASPARRLPHLVETALATAPGARAPCISRRRRTTRRRRKRRRRRMPAAHQLSHVRRGARARTDRAVARPRAAPPPPTRRTRRAGARRCARSGTQSSNSLSRASRCSAAGGARRRHQTGTDEGGLPDVHEAFRRKRTALRTTGRTASSSTSASSRRSRRRGTLAPPTTRATPRRDPQLTEPTAALEQKWGLRTAERRHQLLQLLDERVTSWHAPVWPFESSKELTGLRAPRWPGRTRRRRRATARRPPRSPIICVRTRGCTRVAPPRTWRRACRSSASRSTPTTASGSRGG